MTVNFWKRKNRWTALVDEAGSKKWSPGGSGRGRREPVDPATPQGLVSRREQNCKYKSIWKLRTKPEFSPATSFSPSHTMLTLACKGVWGGGLQAQIEPTHRLLKIIWWFHEL